MKDASNQSSIRRTGVQTPQQEHGDSKEVQVHVHVHIQFQFRSEYGTCSQKRESILLRSRVQIEHGHFCLCDNTTTCVYYKGVWVWRVSFLVLIWDGLIRIGNWMILFLAGWSSLFVSVMECYTLPVLPCSRSYWLLSSFPCGQPSYRGWRSHNTRTSLFILTHKTSRMCLYRYSDARVFCKETWLDCKLDNLWRISSDLAKAPKISEILMTQRRCRII